VRFVSLSSHEHLVSFAVFQWFWYLFPGALSTAGDSWKFYFMIIIQRPETHSSQAVNASLAHWVFSFILEKHTQYFMFTWQISQKWVSWEITPVSVIEQYSVDDKTESNGPWLLANQMLSACQSFLHVQVVLKG